MKKNVNKLLYLTVFDRFKLKFVCKSQRKKNKKKASIF